MSTFRETWSAFTERWDNSPKRFKQLVALAALVFVIALPFFSSAAGSFTDNATKALAYAVMALGLNIVVGFAGLLDLGYVAFYAFGAYTMGWFASGFYAYINHQKGIHLGVIGTVNKLPGIHINFLFVLVMAAIISALFGVLIGLPTLRLRGDYIAIVTLAFGEIIGRVAVNGDQLKIGKYALTAGRQGITPVDAPHLPGLDAFGPLNLRPWYWTALGLFLLVLLVNFRLRDSRLGRAWIAVREDEVAASSMGVPLVRTKLMAYATGAAFGGMAGAFLAAYLNTVNADQFEFSFSIFILAMVILGGMGSIWGVTVGAIVLSYINTYFIPGPFRSLPSKVGLNFDLTELSFGIFGFLIVIMMILRPAGLITERRRQIELTEGVGDTMGVGAIDEPVYEARA
jgi:branched-chain amino acid transport system permease protein